MSWFVYILECADGSYYTGATTDVDRRLAEHSSSDKGARYTKSRRPVTLRYKEELASLSLARRREIEIQKWTRKKKRLLFSKMMGGSFGTAQEIS